MKCVDCKFDEDKPFRKGKKKPHVTRSSVFNEELCTLCYFKRRLKDDPTIASLVNSILDQYSRPEEDLEHEAEPASEAA